MNRSYLSNIMTAMDIMAMKARQNGLFETIGDAPSWFNKFNADLPEDDSGFRPWDIFPFLKNFVEETKSFAVSEKENKKVSGWWTQIDSSSKSHYFKASYLIFEDDSYLIIEHASDSSATFSLLNRYREYMLHDKNSLGAESDLPKVSEESSGLSLVDELTGLHNKISFLLLADHQLKMAKRKKLSMLIFMINLNNIESINSRFGKAESLTALNTSAGIIKKTFRRSDITARLGHETFAVLALEIAPDSKELIISRLQKNIKRHNKSSFKTYDISLSYGAVTYSHDNKKTMEELIKEAGFQMNENKNVTLQAF